MWKYAHASIQWEQLIFLPLSFCEWSIFSSGEQGHTHWQQSIQPTHTHTQAAEVWPLPAQQGLTPKHGKGQEQSDAEKKSSKEFHFIRCLENVPKCYLLVIVTNVISCKMSWTFVKLFGFSSLLRLRHMVNVHECVWYQISCISVTAEQPFSLFEQRFTSTSQALICPIMFPVFCLLGDV